MSDLDCGRRGFLRASSALGMGLGSWRALSAITPANAKAMTVDAETARFRPEIEPVVRWIEETPRDKVIESAVEQLKKGLPYRDLMAGLFLAGIRNIKPHPVGFKFHAVMVIHSAHALGQAAGLEERLLPMLWAFDTFKSSQEQDVKEGDWTLGAVDESKLPSPSQAKAAYLKAMEAWDAPAADVAIASLCRNAGASETMEPIWRMAVRDQRNIGHKPIFAAQSWRTLQVIGWQHAEPVLRSLSLGLLDLHGDERPLPIGPYQANLENAAKVRPDWTLGKHDPAATQALLQTIRTAKPEEAASEAAKLLNNGIAPESLWDAVVLSSNELLMQSPGIVAIHATTSANALHYIFQSSGDDTTRKLALLQAVGWQPLYRGRAKPDSDLKVDALEPIATETKGEEALAEIFHDNGGDRAKATRKAVAYLNDNPGPAALKSFFDTGHTLIFRKGRDSHDYKFGAAALEECRLAADPKWQKPLAAASLFNLPSTKTPDSPLMIRAREAVATIVG